MAELEVLTDAAVLIDGERIAALGRYADLRPGTGNVPRGVEVVEVAGVLFPGFVDCHTHAVFGAPRLEDHERRALGMDYKAIAAEGGGILESVRDVRARSDAELAALTRARLGALLSHGATTIDRKSTRLNSSHSQISYAVFCLKKKKNKTTRTRRERRTVTLL